MHIFICFKFQYLYLRTAKLTPCFIIHINMHHLIYIHVHNPCQSLWGIAARGWCWFYLNFIEWKSNYQIFFLPKKGKPRAHDVEEVPANVVIRSHLLHTSRRSTHVSAQARVEVRTCCPTMTWVDFYTRSRSHTMEYYWPTFDLNVWYM